MGQAHATGGRRCRTLSVLGRLASALDREPLETSPTWAIVNTVPAASRPTTVIPLQRIPDEQAMLCLYRCLSAARGAGGHTNELPPSPSHYQSLTTDEHVADRHHRLAMLLTGE